MICMTKKTINFLIIGGALALAASNANAITYNVDNSTTSNIPGLTGFATTGAMMSGMSVQAVFSNGLDQTRSWATTGATSGGVTGSGWALGLATDSFGGNWMFQIDPNAALGQLTTLVLNGNPGFTVFDRTQPDPGTPGSASGWDFELTGLAANIDATVTYSDIVSVAGNAAVGDLFHVVTVAFGSAAAPAGPSADFNFIQDTDNDSRFGTVPEPASVMLMGLGLVGLAATRRRKRSV